MSQCMIVLSVGILFPALFLSQRKQQSSSSSTWTALVFSGMPAPDSLMDIDLDLVSVVV